MPYEIQVEEVPEMLVASVHRHVSMATVGTEMPEAFRQLGEAVREVGYGVGMPGAEYLGEVNPETDWEMVVFMPVARPFEPPEGMRLETLRGGTFASTIHRGRYDRCGEAYGALHAWMAEHGKQVVGPPRELYLNDPNEVGPDATEMEILFPIG
ncbi:MAG: GyrI-like domain-containing protein [Candidatus Velamenicoccus archaeovorus]